MNNKKNILVLCGGKSGEHEISLLSTCSVFKAINTEKYEVYLVGIDKYGQFHYGDFESLILGQNSPKTIKLNEDSRKVHLSSDKGRVYLKDLETSELISEVDVVFPVMHGTFGEDGAIQGLLEFLQVAYVGSGVLGSTVCMDKDITKRLLEHTNIRTAKSLAFRKYKVHDEQLQEVINKFGFPLFIKPANLGSSVGVSKAKSFTELKESVNSAFKYDNKVIIEEYIKGREIEVAILGNEDIMASIPGEITPTHEFYDYEAKYIDENGCELIIPAKLDEEKVKEIQDLAIQTFKTLQCRGLARVDFFIKENGEIYVNEVNTIPGFTNMSMYPKLFEASGISYTKLLDKLIELALSEYRSKFGLKRNF
jgi:D-alanine-D-alanine ligase